MGNIIPRDFVSRLVYKVLAVSAVGAIYAACVNLSVLTPSGVA